MRLTESRIVNPERMSQLIDFSGLCVDGYIYPTDIDGIIEYKDLEYIIFEVKHSGTETPVGQKLALKRMADDFAKLGKRVLVLICDHKVRDAKTPIIAAWCRVRELYFGTDGVWHKPKHDLSMREAVELFHAHTLECLKNKEVNT